VLGFDATRVVGVYQPFPAGSLPPPVEIDFPPASEEELVVYKLDLTSGNTSQGQAKMLQTCGP
jgi:hypothetical protein